MTHQKRRISKAQGIVVAGILLAIALVIAVSLLLHSKQSTGVACCPWCFGICPWCWLIVAIAIIFVYAGILLAMTAVKAVVKELLEPVAVAPRHKAQRNVNIPRQRKARNHGHSVRHAKQYDAIVSLNQLTQAFEAGSVIRIDTLKSMGIVPADADGYKVLVSDNEKADRPLIIHATSFSSQAKQAIIEAGGQAIKVYH